MEELLGQMTDYVKLYGLKVLMAVVIFIVGRIVISILLSTVKRLMKKSNMDVTLAKFLTSLMRALLMTVLVIVILGQLGVETTSFVAILGAAGLAVGFALQGSLANFASGVMLIIFHPFRAGDFVEAGGTAGVVEEVTIFNTVMRTGDNKKVIIPNGAITSSTITNYSAKETRRIDMVFGIGYDDDLKKAKQILERILGEDDRILKDPAPVVAVSELADSSVNFIVRPWVKTADYWAVYWDLTEKIKLTFDQEGISIPFPQRDVHVHQITAA